MIAFLLASTALCALLSSSFAQVGPTSTSLVSFATGADGLLFNNGVNTGYAVAQIGDYNGDGTVDFAVSGTGVQSYNNGIASGAVVLVLGTIAGWTADVDMTFATSDNTVRRIYGSDPGISLGSSVGGAGDVNLDGFDDLLVGASGLSYNGSIMSGAVLVVFGLAPPYTDLIFNASFVAGSEGYAIFGAQAFWTLAYWNSNTRSLGDIDGDDFEDFAVTGMYYEYAGRTMSGMLLIIRGSSGAPSNLVTDSLGGAGITIGGSSASGTLGYSVDGLGDFNGDTAWDVVVSEPGTTVTVGGTTRSSAGVVYVLFGGVTLVSQDLANFVTGTAGVRIVGAAGDGVGYGVAFADVNGDTISDVVLGAPSATVGGLSTAGKVYVVFGSFLPFTADVDLLTLTAGAAGFTVLGNSASLLLGWGVSRAGDMNSDGVDDFLISALGGNQGEVTVVYGSATVPTADIDLATATPAQVYTITSAGGNSVFGGYDVTGDGYPDLMAGNSNAGSPSAVLLKGPLPRSGTLKPSAEPSMRPTAEPSSQPSSVPSVRPSAVPSSVPSTQPSSVPSGAPSVRPLAVPSAKPLAVPTSRPSTLAPTVVVRASSDRTTSGHLTSGGIAGVVIGAVFLILLATTCALFVLATRRSRQNNQNEGAAPASPPAEGYEMTGV